MSTIFSSLKTFFISYRSFFRGAGSVIGLFPASYHRKLLSKKYCFTCYISDDQAMFADWKQVGDELKSVMATKNQFLSDRLP